VTKDNKKLIAEQKAGANAQAVGNSFLDNPHYKSARIPDATGQSLSDWEATGNGLGIGLAD
jgi:hypothetical protein